MATDLMNPVQCRKCDNPEAKFHCNTCDDVLCPSTEGNKDTVSPVLSSSNSSATQRSLIPKPAVQFQLNVVWGNPHIACVDQGPAWVVTGNKTLKLVDREGLVMDTIGIDFDICDIALTPHGDLLMADYSNSCVRLVSRQTISTLVRAKATWAISTLFRTSGQPWGLCCLHNGDIVVIFGNDSKVEVYNRNGQLKWTIGYKFRYPYKVAINKVNQDICICDHDSGISYTGKLIAIKTDGQPRYEYSGQCDKKLSPSNVCTDQI